MTDAEFAVAVSTRVARFRDDQMIAIIRALDAFTVNAIGRGKTREFVSGISASRDLIVAAFEQSKKTPP